MKKISYSQDVDAILIELSNEPIADAEDKGQVILHYSQDAKLVLVEILLNSAIAYIQQDEKLLRSGLGIQSSKH